MKIKVLVTTIIVLVVTAFACTEDPKSDPEPINEKEITPPVFNADSAYSFVQTQVDFGPRVPGTPEHAACANYLSNKLKSYGAEVIVQESTVEAYNGNMLPMMNVIGQFQPEKTRRLLLFAHWDTRPYADKDSLESNWMKPIDGANDGASGVGVLLEVARNLQNQPTDYGIDIIFFDVEDYGTPEFYEGEKKMDTWCLGSQYWGNNPHKSGYKAKYGILLDMVGAKDAQFAKEGTSVQLASNVMRKIFKNAKSTGNSQFFNSKVTQPTTDDHYYVNTLANIPSAAIVEFYQDVKAMGFGNYGFYHHTHKDNMDIIDRATLEAVGETVMYTIYNE